MLVNTQNVKVGTERAPFDISTSGHLIICSIVLNYIIVTAVNEERTQITNVFKYLNSN